LSPHHSSSCSATTATTRTPTDNDIARETLFAFTFRYDSVHSQELILLHPKRLLDSFDTSYWQLLWIAFVQYLVRILNLLAQVASFLFCVCLYLSSSDLGITLKFTLPFWRAFISNCRIFGFVFAIN
jgi:hypothetical protein